MSVSTIILETIACHSMFDLIRLKHKRNLKSLSYKLYINESMCFIYIPISYYKN